MVKTLPNGVSGDQELPYCKFTGITVAKGALALCVLLPEGTRTQSWLSSHHLSRVSLPNNQHRRN